MQSSTGDSPGHWVILHLLAHTSASALLFPPGGGRGNVGWGGQGGRLAWAEDASWQLLSVVDTGPNRKAESLHLSAGALGQA